MSMKVLVADDSPTIRRRASATLSDAGFEVTCVEDGRAAWRELDSGRIPDVVLCDVLMPEMDGYELCQMVKADERLRRIPVMLLRGTFEPWDQARAESVGADGFITKPFEPEALVSTLREVVEESSADAQASSPPAASDAPERGGPLAPAAPVGEKAATASAPDEPGAELDAALAETEEVARHPVEPAPSWNALDLASPSAPEEAEAPLDLGDTLTDVPLDLGDTIVEAPIDEGPPEAEPLAASEPARDTRESHEQAPAHAGAEAAWMAAPSAAPFDEPFALGEEAPAPAARAASTTDLDDEALDRLARKVVERISAEKLVDIAWEVVPEVAEALIRKRLLEIEARLARD